MARDPDIIVTEERVEPEPPKLGIVPATIGVTAFAAILFALAQADLLWMLYLVAGAYAVWLLIR